jgi:Hypervirulence associated proteins TUDOR domain
MPRMGVTKGSTVSWNTSQGETTGKAVEKKTSEFEFAGQKFKASDDEPYWIVESEKSGKKAAHKESTLKKK